MDAPRSLLARIDYCPLPGRPRLRWPNDARLAFWVIPIMPPPDHPTVTHREYGHRVGMFRLFELFDAHAIRETAAVDTLTAQGYPQLLTECRRRGWEVIAHGVGQRRAITVEMSEADERAYIRAALDLRPRDGAARQRDDGRLLHADGGRPARLRARRSPASC